MSQSDKKWWMGDEAPDSASPERAQPASDDAPERDISRRGFLARVGFGAAVTATACASPSRQALPFLDQPDTVTVGVSTPYASVCGGCAAGCGVLVSVRDGRPLKIEGNPAHPVSRGGVCAIGHAAPMALYDASRPLRPTVDGDAVGWSGFDRDISRAIQEARTNAKEVVLLTGAIPRSSPTTRLVIERFLAATGARHVAFEPLGPGAIAAAHAVSHGVDRVPDYRFDRADVVVSFGADFLGTWLSPVTFARRWSELRRPDRESARMSRVYQLEGRMSLTGTNADERIRLAPSERYAVLAGLTRRIAARVGAEDRAELDAALRASGERELDDATLERIAGDLLGARGRALVVSDSGELRDQLLVNRLNELLDAYGATVDLDGGRPSFGETDDPSALIAQMEAGAVGVLIAWGANPAYAGPAAASFASAMANVPTTVAITDRRTETAAASRYVAPETHFMEGWSDAEPRPGVVSVRQPTFRPIRAQRPGQQSLLRWSGERTAWVDFLRASWARNVFASSNAVWFTGFWDIALRDGFAPVSVAAWAQPDGNEPRYGDRVPAVVPPLVAPAPVIEADEGDILVEPVAVPPVPPGPRFDPARVIDALRDARPRERGEGTHELVAHADASIGDGHHANNPWLQEVPDPITKVSWDNHLSVSRATASELGLALGDVVEVRAGEARVELPVVIQPGQHDGVVSVALGYGRRSAGPVAEGIGVDVWPLVALGDPAGTNVSLRKTGANVELARTQWELDAHGRPVVREASLAEYVADEHAGNEPEERRGLPLWRSHPRPGHRWGMTIDLNACIGCTACAISCQVENNVSVVGKDEVRRFRDMHWIRIDRYFGGDADDPDVVHQPMLCQHCDNAPCETVCPALATMQSAEGLNQMIYNRCVGTRYCANNCPFKVRRFNWLAYAHEPSANLALNPDVVVRTRGVMEKCSFCVQRIHGARWRARMEGREMVDGDVQTACQQSCPTQAITFGDLNDGGSEVARRRREARAYRLIEETNVEPVVYYLTRIRNREEG